ncbi:MAG: hypothetical protein ABGY09_00320 [Euryarchaeota archaeon]
MARYVYKYKKVVVYHGRPSYHHGYWYHPYYSKYHGYHAVAYKKTGLLGGLLKLGLAAAILIVVVIGLVLLVGLYLLYRFLARRRRAP